MRPQLSERKRAKLSGRIDPEPAQKISQEIFKRLGKGPTLGAFMGKLTYEVHAAKSVDALKGNTELSVEFTESVETLHSRAEMPKIKSRPQQVFLAGVIRCGKLSRLLAVRFGPGALNL
ncbi:MAG: hypothetical protein Q8N80_01330 [Candidatus Omnitrophota bacterium]|nr:hypothetical protein [Candidatus Omnitrophota bacterium]